MRPNTRPTRSGFTLLELLVSIILISILMAMSFPMIAALMRDSRGSAATNTVTAGLTAAAAYAVQAADVQGRSRQAAFDSINDQIGGRGQFSGVAALFTPANEIRLVGNSPDATAPGGGYLEFSFLPQRYSGYADIKDRDYIALPSTAVVLGITRDRLAPNVATPGLVLLVPPFAIRFDQTGRVVARVADHPTIDSGPVHYDGNYDGAYDRSAGRRDVTGGYAFWSWRPGGSKATNTDDAAHDSEGRWWLPFERIETVIGVVVVDSRELASAMGVLYGANQANWLPGGRAVVDNNAWQDSSSPFYKPGGSNGQMIDLPPASAYQNSSPGLKQQWLIRWALETGETLMPSRYAGTINKLKELTP